MTKLIDGPFNVPEPPLEEDKWESEYQMALDAVGKNLSQFGSWAECLDAEFAYGWPIGQTRGVGVVVNHSSSLGRDVLEACVKALKSIDPEYVIAINGEFGIGEDFYLAVKRTGEVFAHCDELLIERKLEALLSKKLNNTSNRTESTRSA